MTMGSGWARHWQLVRRKRCLNDRTLRCGKLRGALQPVVVGFPETQHEGKRGPDARLGTLHTSTPRSAPLRNSPSRTQLGVGSLL